eukprot:s551_g21.t1
MHKPPSFSTVAHACEDIQSCPLVSASARDLLDFVQQFSSRWLSLRFYLEPFLPCQASSLQRCFLLAFADVEMRFLKVFVVDILLDKDGPSVLLQRVCWHWTWWIRFDPVDSLLRDLPLLVRYQLASVSLGPLVEPLLVVVLLPLLALADSVAQMPVASCYAWKLPLGKGWDSTKGFKASLFRIVSTEREALITRVKAACCCLHALSVLFEPPGCWCWLQTFKCGAKNLNISKQQAHRAMLRAKSTWSLRVLHSLQGRQLLTAQRQPLPCDAPCPCCRNWLRSTRISWRCDDFASRRLFATISRPQELHRHRKRLENFGKDAPSGDAKVLDDCRQLLKDEDWFARKVAVETIAKVSKKGDETQLSLLYTALEDDDIFVREAAVDAVVQVALPEDAVAVSKISVCLTDEDCFVRCRAVVALGILGTQQDRELLTLILEMLEDGFVPVRKRAVEALRKLGDRDVAVLERLRSVSQEDNDRGVREEAKKAAEEMQRRRPGRPGRPEPTNQSDDISDRSHVVPICSWLVPRRTDKTHLVVVSDGSDGSRQMSFDAMEGRWQLDAVGMTPPTPW